MTQNYEGVVTPPTEPAYWQYATRHTGRVFVDDPDGETGTVQFEVEDEDFARMRLDWWRQNRPDVASSLLRRPVYIGEWQQADQNYGEVDRDA